MKAGWILWNDYSRKMTALFMMGILMVMCLNYRIIRPARPSSGGYDAYPAVTWEDRLPGSGLEDLKWSIGLSGRWNPLTSQDSPFAENYESLVQGDGRWQAFGSLRRYLYRESSYVIPGIRCTNLVDTGTYRMVPQGVCTAGGYVLISAYCYNEKNKKNSVIYVLDETSGAYLTTLVLNLKSHVGALASDEKYVYIADSNITERSMPGTADGKDTRAVYTIWKYPIAMIHSYTQREEDAVSVYLKDYIPVSVCPDFLCTYGGMIFAGDFNLDGSAGRGESYMRGYDSATGKRVLPDIALGKHVQGVDIADLDGKTYLVTSSSYGRNNRSRLTCYRLWKSRAYGWFRLPFAVRQIALPNMSEDICIDGDHLLVNFESASRKYQEKNHTQLQLDRVLNLSFRSFVRGTILVTPYAG